MVVAVNIDNGGYFYPLPFIWNPSGTDFLSIINSHVKSVLCGKNSSFYLLFINILEITAVYPVEYLLRMSLENYKGQNLDEKVFVRFWLIRDFRNSRFSLLAKTLLEIDNLQKLSQKKLKG